MDIYISPLTKQITNNIDKVKPIEVNKEEFWRQYLTMYELAHNFTLEEKSKRILIMLLTKDVSQSRSRSLHYKP